MSVIGGKKLLVCTAASVSVFSGNAEGSRHHPYKSAKHHAQNKYNHFKTPSCAMQYVILYYIQKAENKPWIIKECSDFFLEKAHLYVIAKYILQIYRKLTNFSYHATISDPKIS